MKKFKNILALSVLTVALGACSGQGDPANNDPEPTVAPTTDPVMIAGNSSKTEEPADFDPDEDVPLPSELPISDYEFTLTAEEEAVYERLKTELTSDVFEGLSPISVAKIYVQCGIDGEWEAEWATFSPDTITVEKEDFQYSAEMNKPYVRNGLIKISADWTFPFLDDGVFTQEGNTGYIEFEQASIIEDEPSPNVLFTLIQNEKGIWEMQYNPVSFPSE